MKHLCLIFTAIVFFASPQVTFALNIPGGKIDFPNNNSQRNGNSSNSNNAHENANKSSVTPVPTTQANPTAFPTSTPVPTKAPVNTSKPSPTPTSFSTANNLQSTDGSAITIPKDTDTSHISSQPNTAAIPAPAKSSVTTDSKQNAVSQNNQQAASPLNQVQNIIAPPTNASTQVKGANYYNEERLTPSMTAILLYISLAVFWLGMLILKLPAITSALAKLKQRFTITEHKPFTIPYIDVK